MTGHHGLVAITLAVAGVLVWLVSSGEWAAPLFSFALVEGAFAAYGRWSKRAEQSTNRATP